MKLPHVVLLLSASATLSVHADEADFFDSIDVEDSYGELVEAPVETTSISFTGELGYRVHYALVDKMASLDFYNKESGLALSRLDAQGQVDWSVTAEVLIKLGVRAYQNDITNEPSAIEIHESYIEYGKPQGFKVKFGRQFVVFGESDFFQVVDVVNPTDERELGLAELDETRLPVLSSRFSYVSERWGTDLVLIHEHRPNRTAESRGDYDPYISAGGREQFTEQAEPDVDFINNDIAARLFLSRSWGDMSLVYGNKYDNVAAFIDYDQTVLNPYILGYPKVKTYGVASNYIAGNWLLKSEYAYSDGMLFNSNTANLATVEKPQHEGVVGFRYSGISNVSVNWETQIRLISDHDNRISDHHVKITSMLDLGWKTMQDSLNSTLFWAQGVGDDTSGFVRIKMDYDVNDLLTVSSGVIVYYADEGDQLYTMQDNDRLFLGASYAF